MRSLTRHIDCDWGDLCEEDKETNDKSVENGGRFRLIFTEATKRKSGSSPNGTEA